MGNRKTVITDPIMTSIEFALKDTLERYKNTTTYEGKIIKEGIARGEALIRHIRIFGVESYGKSREEYETSLSEKRNIIIMTDEELERYKKIEKLSEYMEREGF